MAPFYFYLVPIGAADILFYPQIGKVAFPTFKHASRVILKPTQYKYYLTLLFSLRQKQRTSISEREREREHEPSRANAVIL